MQCLRHVEQCTSKSAMNQDPAEVSRPSGMEAGKLKNVIRAVMCLTQLGHPNPFGVALTLVEIVGNCSHFPSFGSMVYMLCKCATCKGSAQFNRA